MKFNRLSLVYFFFFVSIAASGQVPSFSSSFYPSTIGPGSSSMLTFTITNGSTAAKDIAFTSKLPPGVFISAPANASFSGIDGLLTANSGADSINFSGGKLGINETQVIKVYVTSPAVGNHPYTTNNLTSNLGSSGTAAANLNVSLEKIGFSSSFDKSSILVGETATLTYAFDYNLGTLSSVEARISSAKLPSNLVIANPVNVSNTCSSVITANPGDNTISLDRFILSNGSSCLVSIDVKGIIPGKEPFLSTELYGEDIAISEIAVLSATTNGILFEKSFSSEVIAPGDTALLTYSITNADRSNTLTAISFTDNLNALLGGFEVVNTPITNTCSAASSLTGGIVTFSGGSIPTESSCTFSVKVVVPANATAGKYTSETSEITATRNSSPVTGGKAKATFHVYGKSTVVKEFLTNPIGIGSSTVIRYTITNNDLADSIIGLTFKDDINGLITYGTITNIVNGCNAGSSAYRFFNPGENLDYFLVEDVDMIPNSSCFIELTFTSNVAGGNYIGELTPPVGTIAGFTLTGVSTDDTLSITHVPKLTKNTSSAAFLPGDTLTFEYELSLSADAAQSFDNITFTDDFSALLSASETVALQVLAVETGGYCPSVITSGIGTNSFGFSNGSLTPGKTCTVKVRAKVPPSASVGNYTSTTSSFSGNSFTGENATDDFGVIGLIIKKEYSQPTFPGDTMTISYALINPHSSENLSFINGYPLKDKLDIALSGLTYFSSTFSGSCGASPTITGSTTLSIAGIAIPFSDTCKLDVLVAIPLNSTFQEFNTEITAPDRFAQNGVVGFVNHIRLIDGLFSISPIIAFSKKFLSDANPTDTVSLEFTVKNFHPSESLTDINFTDNIGAMHAGFTAINLPESNIIGAGSTLSGTTTVALSAGTVDPLSTSTFVVKVKVPEDIFSGTFNNTTSPISFKFKSNLISSNAASADLIVKNNRRPTFTKYFAKDTLLIAGTTTLTFTINNSLNITAVNTINFSDNFPEGMVIANIPNITNSCSIGTVTGIVGSSTFSVANASISALSTCTYSVDVTIDKPKNIINTSEELTSNVGSSGTAKDTIYVKMPEPSFFSATNANHNSITLAASPNSNMDSVLVVFATNGVFGSPSGFLSNGDNLTGGGQVFYKGLAQNMPTSHTGLSQSTHYSYRIWSLAYDRYSDSFVADSEITFCSSPKMNYYLAYADGGVPEIIAPLTNNLEIQYSTRPTTVVAIPTCTLPKIESVRMHISGTTTNHFYIDNNMPYALHETNNIIAGDVLENNFYTFIARGYEFDNSVGKLLTGPDIINFLVVPGNRQIAQPTFSTSKLCPGGSFVLSTSVVAGSFKAGNLFHAYLSDSTGGFSNPILIGSSNDPGNINCTIPNYVQGGEGYKVKVNSTEPIITSLFSTASLIISSNLKLVSSKNDIDNASDGYISNSYKSINTIEAENKITGNVQVVLQAKSNIQLNPGFLAANGAVFRAEIKDPVCPL